MSPEQVNGDAVGTAARHLRARRRALRDGDRAPAVPGATPVAVIASIVVRPAGAARRASTRRSRAALDDLVHADARQGAGAPADGEGGRAALPAALARRPAGVSRRARAGRAGRPSAARRSARSCCARYARVKRRPRPDRRRSPASRASARRAWSRISSTSWRSRGERPTIARGRCSESLAGIEAYLPILEVLDGLLHRSDGAVAVDA